MAVPLLLGLIGCRQRLGSPDLLVITVDTARADRFSYAGDSPVSTPNIDALAAESTAFLQAVAPAPLTLVSHASLFTGLQPPAHGVRNNGTYRLADSATTLAELLRGKGYRTGAFVGAAVLDSKYGLDQGFDHYDDAVYEDRYHPERQGGEVVRAALDWLDDQSGRPTLAWVHLFDPHDPHRPPEPERSSYPTSPYDGEIAYVDRVVGNLLSGYRQRDRYRRLVVLFTADHGESLGEHGEETHGVFLYDATITVPLLIRLPGVGEGRRVATQVQLIDALPTLAEGLDLEMPAGVQGRSLVPAMRGESMPPQAAYAESFLPRENYGWSELRSLRAGGWKLVLGASAELYDLRADPRESRDLAADEPERVARMKGLLERQSVPGERAMAERLEMDDATRRQLAALGYLSTAAPRRPDGEDPGTPTTLPDPRGRIHLIRARSRAAELFDRGFHQEGIERSRSILEQDPANLWVRRQLSAMLLAAGQFREADELLSALVQEHPGAGWAWHRYATLQERVGRRQQAISAYLAAFAVDPADVEARARAWQLLYESGDRERVRAEAAAALAADPRDSGAEALLALSSDAGGDAGRLAAQLEAELRTAPEEPELLSALGEAYVSGGRHQLALPLQSKAQSLVPDSHRYAIRLARTLAALGRPQDVRQVLRNLRKRGIFEPTAWLLLGEACLSLGDGPCAAAALQRLSALVPGPLEVFLRSAETPNPRGRRTVELLTLAGRLDEAVAVRRLEDARVTPEGLYDELLRPGARRRSAATAARQLLARGDAGAARRTLEPLFRAHPLDLQIALAYGEVCARLTDDGEVREVLTLLAQRLVAGEGPPFRPQLRVEDRLRATAALTRIGSASWDRRVYSNASHAYLIGTHLVPDDPRTHYNLGLAWERLGDYQEAMGSFDRTLALDPGFPRAREHRAALAHMVGQAAPSGTAD